MSNKTGGQLGVDSATAKVANAGVIEFSLQQFRKNKYSENLPGAKAEEYANKSLGLFLGDISSRDQSNLDDQSTSHRINEEGLSHSHRHPSQFKEVTINEIKMKSFLN